MSAISNQNPEVSLSNTLILALSQCQEQVRQLANQSKVIEDLRLQNDQLSKEVERLKTSSTGNNEAKYAAQFQDVFKQVAEKQGEIDRLKEKLRSVKIKTKQRGLSDGVSSSPAFASSGTTSRSPLIQTSIATPETTKEEQRFGNRALNLPALPIDSPAHPPQKRARSSSPHREPLREISTNVEAPSIRSSRLEHSKPGRQLPREKAIAAIPELTEDGDDHFEKRRKKNSDQKVKFVSDSVYHRLNDLLEARVPDNPVILRTRSNSPPLKGRIAQARSPTRPKGSITEPHTPITNLKPRRPRSTMVGPKSVSLPGPEDEEPFRARPLRRLGLTHFKINPDANSGLDYAYDQVTRGQGRKCFPGCTRQCCVGAFRALVSTLPKLPGQDGSHISDDDLLLQFMGPGSEERIRTLTPTARENLLHEARTKIVANAFGKMHRDAHERGRSPPGFWRTDMPGSQEFKDDRELANAMEREEVAKRYHEAMKDGGRWMFADE